MTSITQTYSVRDLQRNYRAVIDSAKKSHDAVLIINNSVPEAVMLDVETYNALVADSYAYDMKHLDKLVAEAERLCDAGKAKKLKNWDDLDA
ncbi:MAG: type II toxin-antitoxin system Phd/YefM family antitoxin [bacterium]